MSLFTCESKNSLIKKKKEEKEIYWKYTTLIMYVFLNKLENVSELQMY